MPYQQAPARRRGPFNNPFPSFLEVAAASLPQAGRVSLNEEDAADIASDYAPQEAPMPGAPAPTPMQQDDGTNDAPPAMQEVSPLLGGEDGPGDPQQINQRRALANAMLQRGQQPAQGGWLGGLARLTNSVGGAYMGMRADEEEQALKAKTSAAWQSILANSPDEQALISNMMRSDIPEIRDRAVEAQLKSRLVKPTTNGMKVGTLQKREENGTDVYERFDGQNWVKVSSSPTYRPQAPDNGLLPGYETQEDLDQAVSIRGDMALSGEWDKAFRGMRGKSGERMNGLVNSYIGRKLKERGMNAADVILAMSDVNALREAVRTVQNRSTKINLSAAEVDEFANYALGASKTVPRGDLKLANGAMQWLRGQKSDANQAAFNMYNLALASAAAVVAGRGEVNQAMQEEFRKKLDTAMGPAAYAASVKAIQQEARGMLKVGEYLLQKERQMYARRQKEMGLPEGVNTGEAPSLSDMGKDAKSPAADAPAADKPKTINAKGFVWELNPATGKYRNTGKKVGAP